MSASLPDSPHRPLSPHLQIYRFTALMLMSILHRLTGLALYGGMLIFTLWLLMLSMGPGVYDYFHMFATSIIGKVVFFGLAWSAFHHMLGGIRHLIWDNIIALDVKPARCLAWLNIILSLSLTIILGLIGGFCHT